MTVPPPRRNRIVVIVPLYAPVSPRWVMEWESFKRELAAYERNGGISYNAGSHIDLAMNSLVRNVLTEGIKDERPSEALLTLEPEFTVLFNHRNPEIRAIAARMSKELRVRKVDYILCVETDNTMPAGLVQKVAQLDPRQHKIVGFPYVGRTDQNLMPIPGNWNDKGEWERLSYEEFKPMRDNPGMYEVGSVGMGCTAIHRSVFEEWTPKEEVGGWFRNAYGDHGSFVGHDVVFCHRAQLQGHKVWLNTELEVGHIGEYLFTPKTFIDTHEFNMAVLAARAAQDKAEAVVHVGYVGQQKKIRPETEAALERSQLPVQYDRLGPGTERHDLFATLWDESKTFLTVEPDILFRDGDLEELLSCPEPWCGFAGQCPPFGYYVGFGCTKITAELIRKYPDVMRETGTWRDETHTPKHWCRVDGWAKAYLLDHGAKLHIHGPVDHLIDPTKGPAHGCVPKEAFDNPRPMDPPPYLRSTEVPA